MVEVHDQLQSATEQDRVDVRHFFDRLTSALRKGAPAGTELLPSVPHVSIVAADAINIGIIINELVANAIKHGGGDRRVNVTITGEVVDSRVAVCVSDNGPGLPEGFDPATRSGLGMQVGIALAQSLGGRLTWSSSTSGACFRFSFPIRSE